MRTSFATWVAVVGLFPFAARATVPTPTAAIDLPEPALRLMTDEEAFVPYARALAAQVALQLAAHPEPGFEKLLLALQVHLADHLGASELELSTAQRIQALQADPSERAFAGLTTQAAVEARRLTGEGVNSARYAEAYTAAFAKRLATLPFTPEIAAMLRRQRARNEFSRAALLQEARDQIEPQIARHGHPTWEDLDRFIRARHRLTDLLPVQDATLRVLDKAIAQRLTVRG